MNSRRHSSISENEIFKSLLRFSFIERLLPDKNKKISLVRYYDNLKVRIEWLSEDPHYWLQYAMTELTYQNYKQAQRYLDTAYEIVSKKSTNYDVSYIDTQQARLFLIQSQRESDSEIVYDYFIKGHNLLIHQKNNIYKYRQVIHYQDVYRNKYIIFSKKRKNDFIQACKYMFQSINNDEENQEIIISSDNLKNKCLDSLRKITNET